MDTRSPRPAEATLEKNSLGRSSTRRVGSEARWRTLEIRPSTEAFESIYGSCANAGSRMVPAVSWVGHPDDRPSSGGRSGSVKEREDRLGPQWRIGDVVVLEPGQDRQRMAARRPALAHPATVALA